MLSGTDKTLDEMLEFLDDWSCKARPGTVKSR